MDIARACGNPEHDLRVLCTVGLSGPGPAGGEQAMEIGRTIHTAER
jgi:hypothetical protein